MTEITFLCNICPTFSCKLKMNTQLGILILRYGTTQKLVLASGALSRGNMVPIFIYFPALYVEAMLVYNVAGI